MDRHYLGQEETKREMRKWEREERAGKKNLQRGILTVGVS